ncbi:MAG: hypothetical protein KF729_05825 [Sandaracinaceae bacterium]|nr:hypothetical protein [Sandaracinaceae bacterium]
MHTLTNRSRRLLPFLSLLLVAGCDADPGTDAGPDPVDAGESGRDAGGPAVDGGPTDAGPAPEDGGSVPVDAGEPAMDAGEPAMDAGEPAMDAGEPAMDAGEPAIDAGPLDACTPIVWYGDCDNDTWGRSELPISSCERPTSRPTLCGSLPGGWTMRPASEGFDCDDRNMNAFPGQTMFFAIPTEVGGTGYDYDCNGTSEREYPGDGGGRCLTGIGSSCSYTPGFTGAVACGAEGSFITGCTRSGTTCTSNTEMRRQRCR